jgi:hypothetical protein
MGVFFAHDRSRPKTPWRSHRLSFRAAQLGLGAHPPSARAHDRAWWRHLARRQQMDLVPAALLAPGPGTLTIVPPAVSGEARRRSHSPLRAVRQWLPCRQYRQSTRAAQCAHSTKTDQRCKGCQSRSTACTRAALSMLRRPHDHHRDIRARRNPALPSERANASD